MQQPVTDHNIKYRATGLNAMPDLADLQAAIKRCTSACRAVNMNTPTLGFVVAALKQQAVAAATAAAATILGWLHLQQHQQQRLPRLSINVCIAAYESPSNND
jgi:hypothetical protein